MGPAFIILLSLAYWPLQAQTPAQAPKAAAEGPADPLGRNTPRGTVIGFLTAAHKGDWPTATQYIDSTKGENPVELATELSVVLDQGLPTTAHLSDQAQGDLSDNLPPNQELAGTIATNGGPLKVILLRVRRGSQSVWIFSPDTLKEIPAVYDEFNSAWISEYIPRPLLHRGWLGIALWQWVVLALGIGLAIGLASALKKLASPLLHLLFRSAALFQTTTKEQEDYMIDRVSGPLRGLFALLALESAIALMHMPFFARKLWSYTGGGLAIIFSGWLIARIIHVSGQILGRNIERRGGADATAVIRLCERFLIVVTFGVVVVQLLRMVNLLKDVSTLLAGVSIGGVALAFAAQKTLENLFGGVSIIFDRTIRVGDACRIGNQSGTVEDIGLRSTALRTDARTVLTVPNSQLSAMTVENLAMREKIYFFHVVGIRCETSAGQMRGLLEALRKLLDDDARVEKETSHVRLIRLAPSSLDLEIAAYILTIDLLKFLEIQEDLLLRIMDLVESHGTATAFPSQTLYLGKDHAPTEKSE